MKVTINNETVKGADFSGFNWDNFDYGDIVWLEDFGLNVIAAYFVKVADQTVELKALSDEAAAFAAKHSADNVHQIIGA